MKEQIRKVKVVLSYVVNSRPDEKEREGRKKRRGGSCKGVCDVVLSLQVLEEVGGRGEEGGGRRETVGRRRVGGGGGVGRRRTWRW